MRAALLLCSLLLGGCGGNVVVDGTDGGSSSQTCVKCSTVLQGGSLPNVCPGTSLALYQDMRTCACQATGCADPACAGPGDLCGSATVSSISSDCLSCVVSSAGACGTQIQACEGDI